MIFVDLQRNMWYFKMIFILNITLVCFIVFKKRGCNV